MCCLLTDGNAAIYTAYADAALFLYEALNCDNRVTLMAAIIMKREELKLQCNSASSVEKILEIEDKWKGKSSFQCR